MLRVPILLRRLPWLLPLLTACADDPSSGSGTEASTGDGTDATTVGTSPTTSSTTTTSTTGSTTDGSSTTGSTTDASSSSGDTESSAMTGSNAAPVAEDDTFFTAQNATLVTLAIDGVLANDTDPDADLLSVTAFDATSAQGGSVIIAADGRLIYIPAAGFWGPDRFGYTAEDAGGETASATATVFVAPRQIPLADVAAGIGGFVLNGEAMNDWSGYSVSGAGDVNADGMDDIVIGARGASPNDSHQAGRSYVVFGKADAAAVDLGALGAGGFMLNGEAADDYSGRSVSGAGDVNGDGMDDIIVGADAVDPDGIGSIGRSYVVFGKVDVETIDLGALGAGGFVLNGEAADDYGGRSVSGAGDVNGDGMDDVIVGAYRADPNGNYSAGRGYVVFGKADAAAVELGALGAGGFTLDGGGVGNLVGRSVSGAGDVNGDGMEDIIVGADGVAANGIERAGRSYVVFGKADAAVVELGALGGGGFMLNGEAEWDRSGWSVSGAGDVNGDGMDDIIVSAPFADPHGIVDAGRSYVVFGKADSATIELGALGAGGFVVNFEAEDDFGGWSVSGAGDVNGDGMDDIIIGVSRSDPNGSYSAGRSYVVFGKADGGAVDLGTLGAGGFVVSGEAEFDHSGAAVSGAGDVNGDGIDDIIVGAPFADPNGIGTAGRTYVVFGVRTQ